MTTPVVAGLAALLVIFGLLITVWVFAPAFQGREAAARMVGSHRLEIGAWLSVIVLNGLITVPLALTGVLKIDQGLTVGTFVIAAASTDLPMLVFVYLRLIWPGALTWTDLGLKPLPLDYTLRMGIATGLGGLVIIDIVGTLLTQVGLRPNQLAEFEFVLSEGPFAFVILLLAAAVVAPFFEELFFRGFLFGVYRRKQPLWLAYLVSSVLFTILHLEPNRMNLNQMAGLSVGIFMLAMLLAWLYQHTGSLYPGMIAHAINNATGLILFYAFGVR
ncbi:MAG: CPBP family intramembrane metalloprotease [Chloroflexi bacterium]|nr:CPBP family intramembrane metalloprotease [Chloroflexota bacterium]MBV9598223.1 CPBP family intramembrane metalloprotease [Chloroflexota bacterium]